MSLNLKFILRIYDSSYHKKSSSDGANEASKSSNCSSKVKLIGAQLQQGINQIFFKGGNTRTSPFILLGWD